MKDHLTIIIPTFNRYKRLLRLLQYFESYNFPAKIRVLDSSSDDHSLQALQKLLSSEHINYIKYPSTIEPDVKFGQGIQDISTPYFVFCADDDFITPSGMHRCIEFLESHPDYSSAQGRYISFWSKNNVPSHILTSYFYGRNIDINSDDVKERLVQQFSLYKPQFYAVHRTDNFRVFFNIVESKNIIQYNFGLLFELLHTYIPIILGKHKVLPIFYGAREPGNAYKNPDIVPIQTLTKDPKYADAYSRFIESLTLLLADVHGSDKNKAKSQILAGMDAYLNVFLPQFNGGMIKMNASIEECKGEPGYPFFNNTEAIQEWQRMEFFIRKSLSPNNEQGNNAPALNQLGLELLNKGDKQGALNAFLKSLESDPNFASGYQNAGILYLQAGDVNKAFQYFVKSLEVAPGDRNIALNTAKFLRTLKIQSS